MGVLGWILNLWTPAAGDTRYWYGATDDPTMAANWVDTIDGSPPASSVPGALDTAVFPATGRGAQPCTLSANWSLGNLTVNAAQTGTIDLAAYDLTMGDGGNITLDGGGVFDCGTGTISLTNGTFDHEHQTTVTRSTSTVVFNGDCILIGQANQFLANFTVAASATLTIGASDVGYFSDGVATINGAIVMGAGALLVLNDTAVDFGAAGLISADSTAEYWILYPTGVNGLRTFPAGAAMSGGTFTYTVRDASPLAHGGTFGADANVFESVNYDGSLVLEASKAYVFTGTALIGPEGAHSTTFTWDNTNGPTSIEIQGATTFVNGGVTGEVVIDDTGVDTDWIFKGDVTSPLVITWTEGTGDIILNAPGAQSFRLGYSTQTKERLVITSGTVTIAQQIRHNGIVGQSGATLVPNGKVFYCDGNLDFQGGFDIVDSPTAMFATTWHITGDFASDGQQFQSTALVPGVLDVPSWYLNVTGSAVCANVLAAWCDASDGVEIQANDGTCTDGGGNINWNFLVPTYYDVEAVTGTFTLSGVPLAVKRVNLTTNRGIANQYNVAEQTISVNGVDVTRVSLTSA